MSGKKIKPDMELLSPAKINLFLHVTGKRTDGYHDLMMLMCTVSLYDIITFKPGTGSYSITCSDSQIPSDESNLALRAAMLFDKRMGKREGISIHIKKNIPAGAGLGGGSSNAAAILTSLNRYYNSPFSNNDLLEMAETIGSDVPFFICGKPALVQGKGEKIELCENIVPYHVIILFPGIPVSTAEVYKNLNFGLTKNEKAINSPLLNKGLVDPVKHLHNDLEVSAFELCADIKRLKDVLAIHGADGALMSGSGSAVFGLYSDANAAGKAYENLSEYIHEHHKQCSGWKIFPAKMIV